jgi:hypothetical protein
VKFGRLDVQRHSSDEADGVLWWHSFWVVMAFEDEARPDLASPPVRSKPADHSRAGMIGGDDRLIPHDLPRFMAAFAPESPEPWWSAD